MKKGNIATCLLGIVASGISIVTWIIGFVLHVLPNSEQFYQLAETPNEITSIFLALALISYWVVPLTAFIGSIINGFNSKTGGILLLEAALFGCVLPVAYFIVKAYVVGAVVIIPVVLFFGLGLWSVLTKPRVEAGKIVTETKKRNRFVMGIGIVASVVGTILSTYYAYKLSLAHTIFVNNEISAIVLLLSFLVIFGTAVAYLGSFIAGFTSIAGGIFLLLGSICCLAYPVTHVIFGGFSVDLIYVIVLVVLFWSLGIWALCTKQKTKTYTGPALIASNIAQQQFQPQAQGYQHQQQNYAQNNQQQNVQPNQQPQQPYVNYEPKSSILQEIKSRMQNEANQNAPQEQKTTPDVKMGQNTAPQNLPQRPQRPDKPNN